MNAMVNPASPESRLAENVATVFEEARAMPRDVYVSEAFLQRELNQIFKREWFCVGRSDFFSEPGDYFATELANQPIVVVKDQAESIRAYANVCRHRMSTIVTGSGRTRTLVCPYHGWTYGLDGKLRGAPGMLKNRAFDRSQYRLPEIRCEEWLGWVFVTLNPDASPVQEQLSDLKVMIEDFEMQEYAQSFFEIHEWNTNWKILAENFMESYHLPVCHARTIGGLSKVDEADCPEGYPAFNYHTLQKEEEFTLSIAHPDNKRLKGERRLMTYLLAVYPSTMITLTPGYFWYLSLHPLEVGRVRLFFGGGLAREFVNDPDGRSHFEELKGLLDEVNEEDRGCTERVFRGMLSDFAVPGHLSHLERPNYEFARYIASRIPADARENVQHPSSSPVLVAG